MIRSVSHILPAMMLLAIAGQAMAYTSVSKKLNEPAEWYASDDAKKLAANILAWQTPEGGWPKNTETATAAPTEKDADRHATFDNSAGFFEILYLARVYNATHDADIKAAIDKAIDYILEAQYDNGGWPQSYPAPKGYGRYITFNDGTMARIMFLLRDVYTSEHFAFLDDARKTKAQQAWDKGIDCILKCQVIVDGQRTVWGAQHDEKTFAPAPARAFEPVSLCGAESLAVMNLLMHVEHPSPEIIAAVDAAAAWFEKTKIMGIRIEDRPMEGTPKGFERYVIKDPTAGPLWARFYEIGTNKPIFLGRDSVVHYDLMEIDTERRTGYRWYGSWAKARLEKEYPAWRAKVTGATTQPNP